MPKTIALDANLLVLLVVGLTNPKYIATHRRLGSYTIANYELLTRLIAVSAGIVVTPNALSEASNLLRQIGEPAKSQISDRFRSLIQRSSEIYVPSVDACSRREFFRLGLADSAMLEAGKQNLLILSTDAKLCIAAHNAGYESLNFTHYLF
ncbi:MAG: hypothetical protein ABSG46_06320 [Candidatus Binataceae bacterium]|jgi:hypothetical protein